MYNKQEGHRHFSFVSVPCKGGCYNGGMCLGLYGCKCPAGFGGKYCERGKKYVTEPGACMPSERFLCKIFRCLFAFELS